MYGWDVTVLRAPLPLRQDTPFPKKPAGQEQQLPEHEATGLQWVMSQTSLSVGFLIIAETTEPRLCYSEWKRVRYCVLGYFCKGDVQPIFANLDDHKNAWKFWWLLGDDDSHNSLHKNFNCKIFSSEVFHHFCKYFSEQRYSSLVRMEGVSRHFLTSVDTRPWVVASVSTRLMSGSSRRLTLPIL